MPPPKKGQNWVSGGSQLWALFSVIGDVLPMRIITHLGRRAGVGELFLWFHADILSLACFVSLVVWCPCRLFCEGVFGC